jgi:hypothetical protein
MRHPAGRAWEWIRARGARSQNRVEMRRTPLHFSNEDAWEKADPPQPRKLRLESHARIRRLLWDTRDTSRVNATTTLVRRESTEYGGGFAPTSAPGESRICTPHHARRARARPATPTPRPGDPRRRCSAVWRDTADLRPSCRRRGAVRVFSSLALRPTAGQRTLDPLMVVRIHQGQ